MPVGYWCAKLHPEPEDFPESAGNRNGLESARGIAPAANTSLQAKHNSVKITANFNKDGIRFLLEIGSQKTLMTSGLDECVQSNVRSKDRQATLTSGSSKKIDKS